MQLSCSTNLPVDSFTWYRDYEPLPGEESTVLQESASSNDIFKSDPQMLPVTQSQCLHFKADNPTSRYMIQTFNNRTSHLYIKDPYYESSNTVPIGKYNVMTNDSSYGNRIRKYQVIIYFS